MKMPPGMRYFEARCRCSRCLRYARYDSRIIDQTHMNRIADTVVIRVKASSMFGTR
ncbi:hypothetical protein D3C84_1176900 [compost metagenome]